MWKSNTNRVIMELLSQAMKDELRRKREVEKVYQLIHPMQRTRKPLMRKRTLLLPEELKGRDLKKIVKQKRKRNSIYRSLLVK
jgi:hypothetical protein